MYQRNHISDGGEFLVFFIDALHVTIGFCEQNAGQCRLVDHVAMVSKNTYMDEEQHVFTYELKKQIPPLLRRLEEKIEKKLPKKTICITSRKDFLAQPFSYTFLRENPHHPLSQEELEGYVAESQKKAHEVAKRSWSERFLHDPRKMQVLSSTIHGLEIDKKMTIHPLGQLWEHLRLSFLYVFSTKSFFDTSSRFFAKFGLDMVSIIPKQVAHLKMFYSSDRFFKDYLILDFGYFSTTITAHHGWKIQDFIHIPIGAKMYENLLVHDRAGTLLEIRSELCKEKQDGSAVFLEYKKILMDSLYIAFPKLHTRVSTKQIYVTGEYIYKDLTDALKQGALSPYVHPGVSIHHGMHSKSSHDAIDTIQSLFRSGSIFSLYGDPLVNIFRSQLFFHEK